MSTKQTVLMNVDSCLSKAHPDEPVFVLRANDPLFAQTVRAWAAMAYGLHEDEKVEEAYHIATFGANWRSERMPEPAPTPGGMPGTGADRGQTIAQVMEPLRENRATVTKSRLFDRRYDSGPF